MRVEADCWFRLFANSRRPCRSRSQLEGTRDATCKSVTDGYLFFAVSYQMNIHIDN